MTLLPDFQLPVILHIAVPTGPLSPVYLQLMTKNCQLIRGMAC
jgi:hypothetical protein